MYHQGKVVRLTPLEYSAVIQVGNETMTLNISKSILCGASINPEAIDIELDKRFRKRESFNVGDKLTFDIEGNHIVRWCPFDDWNLALKQLPQIKEERDKIFALLLQGETLEHFPKQFHELFLRGKIPISSVDNWKVKEGGRFVASNPPCIIRWMRILILKFNLPIEWRPRFGDSLVPLV